MRHDYKLISGTLRELDHYFYLCGAIGFYFWFPDKYHPIAHAFYCRLDGISRFWSSFCPVRALLDLTAAGRLTQTLFPAKIITSKNLGHYLIFVARVKNLVPGSKFTPHSLRIGGHTFLSIKNMDADFLHFLGRRAISRACQLYYRANAYDNIVRLNMFFKKIRCQHILVR